MLLNQIAEKHADKKYSAIEEAEKARAEREAREEESKRIKETLAQRAQEQRGVPTYNRKKMDWW